MIIPWHDQSLDTQSPMRAFVTEVKKKHSNSQILESHFCCNKLKYFSFKNSKLNRCNNTYRWFLCTLMNSCTEVPTSSLEVYIAYILFFPKFRLCFPHSLCFSTLYTVLSPLKRLCWKGALFPATAFNMGFHRTRIAKKKKKTTYFFDKRKVFSLNKSKI